MSSKRIVEFSFTDLTIGEMATIIDWSQGNDKVLPAVIQIAARHTNVDILSLGIGELKNVMDQFSRAVSADINFALGLPVVLQGEPDDSTAR